MKFIIGLLVGAGIAWGWFSTYGRLQRTDVVIETRTNVVTSVKYETVVATQDVYRTVWQTNTVTVTNIVKKISTVSEAPRANVTYIPDAPAKAPRTTPQQQPTYSTPAPAKTVPAKSSFSGARSLAPKYDKDNRKLVRHTKMDGSIEYTPQK